MTWLGRVLRLFAGNVVPGGGFLFAGWSPATALTLYWIDNLVGSAAMGVRIALHRRWTGASGHDRAQLGATMSGGTGHARRDVGFRSFVAEFLLTSLAFSIAQGVFLAFLLGGIMNALPSGDEVRQGGVGIIVAHVAALTFDARRLASWPFARLKDQATRVMGRVLVVHMTVLGGTAFFAIRGAPGRVLLGLHRPQASCRSRLDSASVQSARTAAPARASAGSLSRQTGRDLLGLLAPHARP